MRGEHGGEIELPHARHDETDAAHPLVEVGDDPADVGPIEVSITLFSNAT